MVVFGVITDRSEQVTDFITKTNERMSEHSMVKNPFHGSIYTLNMKDSTDLHVVTITPIYANFTIFGWMMAFTIFGFSGFAWNWWITPGLLLGCLGIFWMTPFYQFMYKKGIRKAGYKGKITAVKHIEIIKLLCEAGGENGATGSPRCIEGVKETKQ